MGCSLRAIRYRCHYNAPEGLSGGGVLSSGECNSSWLARVSIDDKVSFGPFSDPTARNVASFVHMEQLVKEEAPVFAIHVGIFHQGGQNVPLETMNEYHIEFPFLAKWLPNLFAERRHNLAF